MCGLELIGSIVVIGTKRLDIWTNNEAKAPVALMVIHMTRFSSINMLQLEGELLMITNKIIKGGTLAWKINKIIKIINVSYLNLQNAKLPAYD